MAKNLRNFGFQAILVVALIILITSPLILAKGEPVARLSFFVGEVKVQNFGKTEWYLAIINQSLNAGDKIKTFEDSRAELILANGTVMRLDENTTLDIVELKKDKKGQAVKSKLWVGKVWANVTKLSKRDKFGVESPTAVAAVRATIYRITVTDSAATQIRVYDGQVEVKSVPLKKAELEKKPEEIRGPVEIEGPKEIPGPREVTLKEWVEIIKAQQQISIAPDGSYFKSEFDLAEDAKEEWVRWNKERDEALRR